MTRLLLLLSLFVLAGAQAAQAQSLRLGGAVEQAAQAVRAGDPVYVDPDAQDVIGSGELARIRQRIESREAGRVVMAVLPSSEVGDPNTALRQFAQGARARNTTYVLVTDRSFRAGSTDPNNPVEGLADAALESSGSNGPAATVEDFLTRVAEARNEGGAEDGAGAGALRDAREGSRGTEGGGTEGAGIGGILLLGLVGVGGGAFLLSRRKRRKEDDREFLELKDNVRDDLIALGDDIRLLDLDMELDTTPADAKEHYATALSAYERAETQWERAKRPEDLEPVAQALEEGRFAMTAAKARVEGRQVPERTPPCFFDPRHGPSSREVEWSPPYGAARMVPACEADAQRVERGEDPQAREISYHGQRVPYWQAGPAYGSYAGGYFGGFGGGLLPGLLVGSMLGSTLGGMAAAGPAYGADYGGYGDGGDFGGGDFGGGDFGGGDFGGGDFGGGDFGGGDFGGGGDF